MEVQWRVLYILEETKPFVKKHSAFIEQERNQKSKCLLNKVDLFVSLTRCICLLDRICLYVARADPGFWKGGGVGCG